MILKFYNNFSIININKFIYMFKLVFETVKMLVNAKAALWFVNVDKNTVLQKALKNAAQNCGEMFLYKNWKRGLISNFKNFFKSAKFNRTLRKENKYL